MGYEFFLILWAFHGWVGITYEDIAERKGWETLLFFDSHRSHLDALTKASFVQVPFALGLAWASGGLIKILYILLASYILAAFAIEFLKSSIQWIWISLYLLWIIAIPIVYFTL
ncbi:MAG: hypothetical protein ACKOW3_04980 [Hyphomicrobium sp.]